ncbi:MAG: hypothetical protein HRT90_02735 [Candidatus Margulisbacteria bacterium]|nr:hypothetical protein [Candidatus Margulisiibacteriota bacterium]
MTALGWAGEYRNVDVSSPDIRWSHARVIPEQMKNFGKLLAQYTPFNPGMSYKDAVERLLSKYGKMLNTINLSLCSTK